MKGRLIVARITAVLGTVLVLLPAAFMLGTSLIGSLQRGEFLMDYLIPAELSPVILLGFLFLLAGAILGRSHIRAVSVTFGVLVLLIVGGQLLAMATGLASGETEPEGVSFALVLGSIGLFDLLTVVLGAVGILLVRKLFRKEPAS